MILSFADKATEDLFHGINSKAARRLPQALWAVAFRKMDMLNAAQRLEDLMAPPGNRLEALKGDLQGRHSVRVNDQFRVVFAWTGAGAKDVQVVDYH